MLVPDTKEILAFAISTIGVAVASKPTLVHSGHFSKRRVVLRPLHVLFLYKFTGTVNMLVMAEVQDQGNQNKDRPSD
jgi:hypothetical protein